MNWMTQHWTDIAQIVSYVVAAAAAITALTPTPKDDSIVASIRKVLNVLGLNVGNAKSN